MLIIPLAVDPVYFPGSRSMSSSTKFCMACFLNTICFNFPYLKPQMKCVFVIQDRFIQILFKMRSVILMQHFIILYTKGLSKYLILLQIRNHLELFLRDVVENWSVFLSDNKVLEAGRLPYCHYFISFRRGLFQFLQFFFSNYVL